MLSCCFCDEKKDTLTSKGTWCLWNEETEVDFENAEEEFWVWVLEIGKMVDLGIW
jgi:hypothetical protein